MWLNWISRTASLLQLLQLLLLLHNVVESATSRDADKDNLPETIATVYDDKPRDIASPSFPRCCQPIKYLLKKGKPNEGTHWKLLFTDLDLPPASMLIVYGIRQANETDKVPLGTATYLNGAWIRPVVSYGGYALSVEFNPARNTREKITNVLPSPNSTTVYTGFKAAYWLDHGPWQLDKPFTFCPPIGDAVQRGRVTVKDLELPFDPQHYRWYCVWQLKPVPDSDLQIYIKLEDLYGRDSKVKIHHGLTSDSPMIFSASRISSSSPRTFTSNEGFYIELSKPAFGGGFTMSNGVFKALLRDEECVFQVDGNSLQGFKCEEEKEDLCIPLENKCDKIKDCPSGYDELSRICEAPTTTTTISTTTNRHEVVTERCLRGRCKNGQCPSSHKERCPEKKCDAPHRRCPGTLLCLDSMQSCPGEPCTRYESTCLDGTCLFFYEKCPDGSAACEDNDKRCKKGQCVRSYKRCPEDPCPGSKPHKCDNKCHYQSSVCNGWLDCTDGSDERGCPSPEPDVEDYDGTNLFYLLFLVVIPIICCCCYACCKAFADDAKEGVGEEQNNEERTPMNRATDSIAMTTVIHNDSDGPRVVYQPYIPPAPPVSAPFLAPCAPPTMPSGTVPSAPPAYGDVMSNQAMYHPTPEPPPAYSDVVRESETP